MKKMMILSVFSTTLLAAPRPLPPVIDNSTYPAGSPASASIGSFQSNNALYEVLGRLEQMQLELQQLRGVVEEQAQIIEDLKTRQGNIYTDLDQRLQSLSAPVQPAGAEGLNVAPRQPAMGPAPVVAAEQQTAKVDVNSQAPVNEKQLYQDAFETLRNGHNTKAIAAFIDLLKQFPAGEYADNAQYWLGEAYKVNRDIESAKTAFNRVVELYPTSPKVPDALLKLGYIALDQNKRAKARDYLTQVSVKYPGTTAAHLAAKKLLQLDQ